MNPSEGETQITRKQCMEMGMLLVLGALLLAIHFQQVLWLKIAIVMQLIAMVVPALYYPAAFIWFRLARAIGVIGPAVMLTLVFLLLVTPMGWLRRLCGKDVLRLRAFRKGTASVMLTRNHQYGRDDFRAMF